MNKTISVITVTHNRSKTFLPQAIESVARQVEDGFTHEHIIVDNKSTDQTKRVVGNFARKDKRIKYIFNPRNLGGSGDALNVGFSQSKGSLIVQFDDDDLLPRYSLQFRRNFFQAHPEAKWAYGHIAYIDGQNRLWKDLLEFNLEYKFHKDFLHTLLVRNFIPGGSGTFHRDAIKQVGGWDPERATQDYDLSLKLAAAGFIPHKMDSYVYYYRVHASQQTKLHAKSGRLREEWEFYLNQHNVDRAQIRKWKRN